jgi:4-coumarate--CoA ligase
MAEVVSPAGILPHIPDDLTLAQFILDTEHVRKPVRKSGAWIIDDQSGRKIGFEEVSVPVSKSEQLSVG